MSSHGPNPVEGLLCLNRSSSKFNDEVSNILHGAEYKQRVQHIGGDDVMRLVDFLDEALDILPPDSSGFRRCLRELRHTCGSRTILPTSYTFPARDLTISKQPAASGGSGDVFEGWLSGSKVCVKRVRVYLRDGSQKAEKTLHQEAIMWKRLKHKNIVPLLGITTTPLQLISKWMDGGDLREYVGRHPDVNRTGLVSDVAEGLYFLHTNSVIHGDLKGPNILVDESGHAQITDFGVATVTQNLDSIRSSSGENAHTARWTAPEILNDEGFHSKEADVFSFAMVTIEVFTGDVPFSGSLPAAATLAIINGRRPPRPTHPKFTDDLWVLMRACWNQEPQSRPEVSWILRVLGCTVPSSTKSYLQGVINSSSTITVGRQPTHPGFQNPAAKHTQLLGKTISTTFHSTPPIASQPSDSAYNSPTTPYKDPGFGFDYILPDGKWGPLNGHPDPGRRPYGSTSPSEPSSPLLQDPQAHDFNDPFRGYTDGGGGFHADLPSGDRGVSRSTFHSPDDAQGPGGPSRSDSQAGLLENSSKDHSRCASHADLVIMGGGNFSRRPSKRQPPTSGYATGNASRSDWANGPKSRNQSRLSINDTLPENWGSLPLQAKQDVGKPRSDRRSQTESRTRGTNCNHGNFLGSTLNPPKRRGRGFLRWLKGLLCTGQGHIE